MPTPNCPARFRLATYMAPGDAFHVTQKPLAREGQAPLHCHDYFEVFYVDEGTCRHEVNGGVEALEPGALVFIRPDDRHALSSDGPCTCQITNLMIRPETADHLEQRYAEDLSQRFFWSPEPSPVCLSLAPERRARLVSAFHSLQTGARSLARVEAFLMSLMVDYADLPEQAIPALPHWLARACDAARQPEVYRQGAAGLVEAAGRGHEHVCRQMKRHFGLTPSAYVNRIRMEQAGVLLAVGDRPLADVAADVGLENMSHFHRLFRAHHGVTPGAYCARSRIAPF